MQQRDFSQGELLAWCRFLTITLLGSALSYAREREGSVDGLLEEMTRRLSDVFETRSGGGVEAAMLGLLLNVEAVGGEIGGRAIGPESGEVLVSSLPGERIPRDLLEQFDVALSQEDLLAIGGTTRDELNRLFDLFGAVAALEGFEYLRDDEGDEQRLRLRVW